MDYKYPKKNHWRRTEWNSIVQRLPVPRREAVVVYLAGGRNLDAEIARRKGFDARNLIAVERDGKILASLRTAGANTIDGDFMDVLRYWPREPRISVILGDFCCGLERELWGKLLNVLPLPQCHRVIFALNFLRGRDPSSNLERENFGFGHRAIFGSAGGTPDSEIKHRGLMFYNSMVSTLAVTWALGARPQWFDGDGHFRDDCAAIARPQLVTVQDALTKIATPLSMSYRSESGQVFDSVVFTNPWTAEPESAEVARVRSILKQEDGALPIRRKVAASKAVRTMRYEEVEQRRKRTLRLQGSGGLR